MIQILSQSIILNLDEHWIILYKTQQKHRERQAVRTIPFISI